MFRPVRASKSGENQPNQTIGIAHTKTPVRTGMSGPVQVSFFIIAEKERYQRA
jgi:hypothetical protein